MCSLVFLVFYTSASTAKHLFCDVNNTKYNYFYIMEEPRKN